MSIDSLTIIVRAATNLGTGIQFVHVHARYEQKWQPWATIKTLGYVLDINTCSSSFIFTIHSINLYTCTFGKVVSEQSYTEFADSANLVGLSIWFCTCSGIMSSPLNSRQTIPTLTLLTSLSAVDSEGEPALSTWERSTGRDQVTRSNQTIIRHYLCRALPRQAKRVGVVWAEFVTTSIDSFPTSKLN